MDDFANGQEPEGEVRICMHPVCECEVLDDEFCSQHCREAGDAEHAICACGHEECGNAEIASAI